MPSVYDDLARPPLNAGALRRALLTPGSLWTTLDVLAETPSTNAVLAERAAAGVPSGGVLIAEHQTAGRGRLDRVWTAPARSGLTVSVLVRPDDVGLARWPWIPLLTGLAVAAAMRREAHVPADVKWPNDVVVADRKLAGVLVERVESPGQPAAAVIGIGLNVSLRTDELPTPAATSLALEGSKTTDRTVLARAVLRVLAGLLGDWQRHCGDPGEGLRTAYVDACTTIGQRVEVLLPDGSSLEGNARGVDDSGRLLVGTGRGQVAVSAGDVVHLRRLA
jgi:BirA family biotin operon repressor/biotin-[acetyl-CoA-carboxylase] ligase